MFYLWIAIYIICFVKIFTVVIGVENKNNFNYASFFLYGLLIFGTYILVVSNRTGPDVINYYYNYEFDSASIQNREMVYKQLCFFGKSMGLTFWEFRNILVFVCGSIAVLGLMRLKVSIPILLFFYMPVLLFMDSGQLRNGVCLYVLVYAMFFLLDENIFSTIFFIGIIVFLGQIHTAFIFYLILLFLKIKDDKKRNFLLASVFIGSIAIFLVTILNDHRIPFFNEIKRLIFSVSDSRNKIYSTTAGFGFLFILPLYVAMTTLLKYASKDFVGNFIEKKYISFINGLNICSCIFIPFMMMNMNFYRFVRNSYFFSLIGITLLLKNTTRGLKRNLIILSGVVVTVLWCVFEVVIYDTPKNIIDPILKDGVWFFNP